jgi:hypothetical protein
MLQKRVTIREGEGRTEHDVRLIRVCCGNFDEHIARGKADFAAVTIDDRRQRQHLMKRYVKPVSAGGGTHATVGVADDGVAREITDDVKELAQFHIFLQIGEELRTIHHFAAVERRKHNVLRQLRVVGERRPHLQIVTFLNCRTR